MIKFHRLIENGKPTRALPGDRVIYDERNGTLFVVRKAGGEVLFEMDGHAEARVFVGREWSRDMTRGTAEYYARMNGLIGVVVAVEGSFPTLHAYEVVS